MLRYGKLCGVVEYKELVRRQEEGGLSMETFHMKMEELREYLVQGCKQYTLLLFFLLSTARKLD